MSVITKIFGGALLLFLFPMFASATLVAPQNIDISLEPGEGEGFQINILNTDSESRTYRVKFFSAELGDGPDDLTFGTLSSNITMSSSYDYSELVLESGEEKEWPFSVNLSNDIESGVEVIAAQVYEVAESDSNVMISTGIITLVFVTVGHDLEESAELIDFSASVTSSSSLPVEFYVSLRNTGETILQPTGSVIVENIFRKDVERFELNPSEKRIPEGQERTFAVLWGEQADYGDGFFSEMQAELSDFHIGVYKVRLWATLSPGGEIFTDSVRVVLFPWRTTIVFFGILLVLTGVVFVTRKR